ncbi:YtxH domain-containing protein [Nocardioides antri]|uniref:YtxH domain-containing protein n=1 Tax=Nocardioides antri TaxID=2607659 RepID=A0A5B1M3J3_9ACTN|nr:YtxH domain-containing protein [Nocardioides antri]KAA1427785.1 YtxH domain-containing protein [Nocardioides antri]
MSKFSFLAGVGVGYVLGARAGQQRYEQIKSGAQTFWNNPKVQDTVSHAQDFAAQKAPEVQHKVAETASTVAHKVSEKVGSGEGANDTKETGGGEGGGTAYSGPDTPAGFVENPAK